MNYLTAKQIALKYNRSLPLVNNFAIKNNVPFEKQKKGLSYVTVYKFSPLHEALFVNRKKSSKTSSLLKVFVLLRQTHGKYSTLVFNGFHSARAYLKHTLEKKPVYLKPSGIHFDKFMQSLSASNRGKITTFLRENKNCSFFSFFLPENSYPIIFDISSIEGQEQFVKYFFLSKNKSVFCLIQKEKESTSEFRKRIFLTDNESPKIDKNTLKLLFPSKEAGNDF